MKGISLIAVAVVLAATPALSADLGGKKRGAAADLPEARYVEPAPLVNWNGLYIGGQAGYGIGTLTDEDGPVGLSFESPIVGAVVGYDIARGNMVFGAFAEYTYITADEAEDINDWAAGVRAGVVVAPRTMVYASVAYAQLSDDEDEVNGIRAGLGTEFALTSNLFADLKANYTWYDLEDDNDVADAGDLRVLAGLKFKMNSDILGLESR